MKDLTRRQLAGLALAAAAAQEALAQTAAPQTANTDWLQQARDSKHAATQTLAKFEIPMSEEPSFQFKA